MCLTSNVLNNDNVTDIDNKMTLPMVNTIRGCRYNFNIWS